MKARLARPVEDNRRTPPEQARAFTRGIRSARVAIMPFLAVVLALTPPSGSARGDETQSRPSGNSCITLSQIRRTEVVDDQTILFHLRGGGVRKVTLAFRCPSLRFYGTVRYETYSNRLCARVDTIISRSGSHCPIAEIEDYSPPTETAPREEGKNGDKRNSD